MPKVKEKSYTLKKASQETKEIFENFGHPCQQVTLPALTDAIYKTGSCTSAAHSGSVSALFSSDSCGSQDCSNEGVPVAQGGEAAAPLRIRPLEVAQIEYLDAEEMEESVSCSPVASYNPQSESTFSGCINTEPVAESGNLAAELKTWALKENIPHTAVTSLLKVLKSHPFNPAYLPNDARTLLGTPRNTMRTPAVTAMPPGDYCHFGLEYQLRNILSHAAFEGRSIALSFNIDGGLPISKSSKMQLWPIQCMVIELGKAAPFVVGVFAGESKPASANDFLAPVVGELLQLMSHGMSFKGQMIEVSVKSFICDAPARSFVYSIKGHTGYSGCPKCIAEGTYTNKRVVYPSKISRLRTDDSIRRQTDPDHHHDVSALTELPIDCVSSAPLDYMHLLCLGVQKKLLGLWLGGPLDVRLGPLDRKQLSDLNLSLVAHVPGEFARKPRGTAEVDRWKATEFRLFLLYTGPVVLKSVLPPDLYNNFLALHCGTFLVSSPTLCHRYVDYAESLFQHFVKTFAKLYGDDQVSYNIHCVLHLANDVRNQGPLDTFSAFPFENNMQCLKRLLKSHNTPLAQLYNRLKEREGMAATAETPLDSVQLGKQHTDGPLLPGCRPPQYKCANFPDFVLAVDLANNCCLIDDSIVLVDNFAHSRSTQMPCIIGRELVVKENFYNKPFPSGTIGVFVASQPSCAKCWPIRNVHKLVRFPWGEKSVVIPQLHTL